MSYLKDAETDAINMVENFIDQIVTQLVETGEASTDYNNDYKDGNNYHHEQHVNRAYCLLDEATLLDAATLLDELSRYEEDDHGLWDGQLPRDAIATQAAWTYGNAVGEMWDDYIEQINEREDIVTLLAGDTPAEVKAHAIRAEIEAMIADWRTA